MMPSYPISNFIFLFWYTIGCTRYTTVFINQTIARDHFKKCLVQWFDRGTRRCDIQCHSYFVQIDQWYIATECISRLCKHNHIFVWYSKICFQHVLHMVINQSTVRQKQTFNIARDRTLQFIHVQHFNGFFHHLHYRRLAHSLFLNLRNYRYKNSSKSKQQQQQQQQLDIIFSFFYKNVFWKALRSISYCSSQHQCYIQQRASILFAYNLILF